MMEVLRTPVREGSFTGVRLDRVKSPNPGRETSTRRTAVGKDADAGGWPTAHPRMLSKGHSRRTTRSMERHVGKRKEDNAPPTRQQALASEERPIRASATRAATPREERGTKGRAVPEFQNREPHASGFRSPRVSPSRESGARKGAKAGLTPRASAERTEHHSHPQKHRSSRPIAGAANPTLNLSSVEKAPDQSSGKIHDSAGSLVQKRQSPPRDDVSSYEQQQSPHPPEKNRAAQHRDANSGYGNWSPGKTGSGPGGQDVARPSTSPVKRVAAIQQPVGEAPLSHRESESPQRRSSANRYEPRPHDFGVSSPAPEQQDNSPVDTFGRRFEPRISDAGFDAMRTTPDIMQTADMMRSGDVRWEFLQSADVCWDESVDDGQNVQTPGVQNAWEDSTRTSGRYRPTAVAKQDTIKQPSTSKEGAKQGHFKSFIGRMLGGCLRPNGTADVPRDGAQSEHTCEWRVPFLSSFGSVPWLLPSQQVSAILLGKEFQQAPSVIMPEAGATPIWILDTHAPPFVLLPVSLFVVFFSVAHRVEHRISCSLWPSQITSAN